MFLTNESQVIANATLGTDLLTLGVHPNFLPGSTHGASPVEVIETCRRIVPDANTFRCHSYFEYTAILGAMFADGHVADSNLGLFAQPALQPLMHCTGLIRFPVFFEDDVFYELADEGLSLGPLDSILETPGLKILNFHPSLVAINAPSHGFYDQMRPSLSSGESGSHLAYRGRGVRNVLHEMIEKITRSGGVFVPFPSLVSDCLDSVSTFSSTSYTWRSKRWAQPGGA